jgi:uncharacterized protein YdhG (YjbR/CyaY superfamily)
LKTKNGPKNIDEYIAAQTEENQLLLQKIRTAIHEAAPQAQETISYQMPAFKQKGTLVYFAAFKDHIGFFPTGSGVEAFKDRLSAYKTTKGTIQLPLDEPLPLDLIKEIVRFRVKETSKKC